MLLSSCLLSSCLLFYMCCFLIRLFAVWRYAGRIFNAGICRGKAISEFRSPKALPLHPHPLGHGSNSSLLCVLRCWLLSVCCGTQNGTLCRSGFCILRYLWWYAGPICDLVLRFFGTYSGTLCRSGPCILRYLWCYARPIWSLYSSIFMVIHWADLVPVFFDTYRNILYRSDISGQDAQSDATFLWRPPLHPHHKTSPPRLHPSQTNSTFLWRPSIPPTK